MARMRTDEGFTLLEVLVVVLIITILAAVVGVNVLPHVGKANAAAAKAQLQEFNTALRLYRLDNGRFPTQEQGLRALCEMPAVPPLPAKYPQGGYLERRQVPADPWGREYLYLSPGSGDAPYEVITYGSDGEPGGSGDAADLSSLGP